MGKSKKRILNQEVERMADFTQLNSEEPVEEIDVANQKKALQRQEKAEYLDYKAKMKAEKQQDEEEKIQAKINKRNKKNAKKARHRGLKNFGWWSFGFVSFILAIVLAVSAVVIWVPINTFTGDNTDYVSEDMGKSTLYDVFINSSNYTAGDIPAVETVINMLLEDMGLNKYIDVDIDRVNSATVFDGAFIDELSSSIKVIATISSLGAEDMLGDLGKLKAFEEYKKVENEDLPDESGKEFNEKLYYYQVEDGKYARAFDDEHQRVADAEGKELVYPALNDVVITELGAIFSDRIDMEKMSSLLEAFGMSEGGAVHDIVEDRTVKEMKSFEMNEVKLTTVIKIPEETADNYEKVTNLYKVILDANGIDYDDNTFEAECNELCVGSLSEMDVKEIKLTTVLDDNDGNAQLYSVLKDMTSKESSGDIRVSDLDNVDVTKIKLHNVLDIDENKDMYGVLRDMSYEKVIEQIIIDSIIEEKYKDEYQSATTKEKKDIISRAKEDYNSLGQGEKDAYRSTAEETYNGLTEREQYELISVASLDGGDIKAIKLNTVLGDSSDNTVLNALLSHGDVTIGNMAEKLDGMPVSEVYNVAVFTNNPADAVDGAKYVQSENAQGRKVYTLSDEGTYYISTGCSIWLFMLYNSEGKEEVTGYGQVYTENGKTFSQIDGAISEMAGIINKASVRQLIEAGILDGTKDYTGLYDQNLSAVLGS